MSALKGHRQRLAIGAALAAVLLLLFFRGLEWRALGDAFRRANPWGLAAIVLCTIIVYLARAWRWGYLLAPLARVRFGDLFSITIVGFATALVVPRAGEIVRPYLVGQRYGVRTSTAFATIIVERLVDLITVLFLFVLYLYVLPVPASETHGALLHLKLPLAGVITIARGPTGAVILGLLALVVAFLFGSKRLVGWSAVVLRWLPRRLAHVLGHLLESFGSGLAVTKAPPRALAVIFGQSLIVWLTIAVGFYLNNLAFGIALPFQTTLLLIAFLTVGVAIPTPGMIGGFHAFYLFALTSAYGVDAATAGAAGIAAHALTNLPVLVLGLIFLGREGLTFGAVTHMTDTADAATEGGAAPPDEKKENQP